MKKEPTLPVEFFKAAEPLWNATEGRPQKTLLRLAILRELTRRLHAEKSWCLAGGFPDEAQQYHDYEGRIDKLCNQPGFAGPLPKVLESADLLPDRDKSPSRKVPRELLGLLPTDKIERFDRHWEKAIACEAARVKWEFWKLKAAVRVEEAETCEAGLERTLGQRGVILFADSSEYAELQEGIWPGQWLMVIEPGFDPKSIPLGNIKGLSLSPNPPQWTLLHR